MSSDEFVFRGELTKTPLSSMLATVHRYSVPGVMELVNGGVTKRLFFADGDVIFASSSDRTESLGDHLVRTGTITETQYTASTEGLVNSPGTRHGEVLIQLGYLEPEQLGTAVREQVQAILWSLFNWEEGRVTFRVGQFRDDEVYKIKIPTPRAILAGCRRIADPKAVTAKLGGRAVVFKKLPRPPQLERFNFDEDERKLLELVNNKRTLFELCEEGPMSAGTNARVLYALTELQLVTPDPEASGGIKVQLRG
jgi:hypothetical protein